MSQQLKKLHRRQDKKIMKKPAWVRGDIAEGQKKGGYGGLGGMFPQPRLGWHPLVSVEKGAALGWKKFQGEKKNIQNTKKEVKNNFRVSGQKGG